MTKEQKADRRAKRRIRAWAQGNGYKEPLRYRHAPPASTHVYDALGTFLGYLYLDRGVFRTEWGRFDIEV